MNNYARCLHKLGRVAEAEDFYKQSMELAKQNGTSDETPSANSMNNLAVASSDNARYSEAEALHREVLATRQRERGAESLPAAASLTETVPSPRLELPFMQKSCVTAPSAGTITLRDVVFDVRGVIGLRRLESGSDRAS
jgi:tetratricopeptide (TPR) repeat protein